MARSNYDKQPTVEVPGAAGRCVVGWDAVRQTLRNAISISSSSCVIITIECYTGVFEDEIVAAIERLEPDLLIRSADAFHAADRIDCKVAPFNGGDDPIFGFIANLQMGDFLDAEKIGQLAGQIQFRPRANLAIGNRKIDEGQNLIS